MSCEAVPQNVGSNFFAYSGFFCSILYNSLHCPLVIFLAKIGKKNIPFFFQIKIPNKPLKLFMKKYNSFFVAFCSLKVDCASLKINILPFEIDYFVNSHPSIIKKHQYHLMLEIHGRLKHFIYFFFVENYWKLAFVFCQRNFLIKLLA